MRRIKIVHRVFSSICGITLPSPRIRVDFGICRVQAKRRVVLRNASRTQSNFKFDRTPSLSLTSVARIFYFEYTFIWVFVGYGPIQRWMTQYPEYAGQIF